MTEPRQPIATPNDKTTLFGVIGIVGGLCCAPLGIVFGILSLQEARRLHRSAVLAYVAFGLTALNLLGNLVLVGSGHNPYRRQW